MVYFSSRAVPWAGQHVQEGRGACLHSCQVHPPRLVSVTVQTAQSLWRGNWLGDVTCQIIIFIRLNELEKTHNFQVVTSERKKINWKPYPQGLKGMESLSWDGEKVCLQWKETSTYSCLSLGKSHPLGRLSLLPSMNTFLVTVRNWKCLC